MKIRSTPLLVALAAGSLAFLLGTGSVSAQTSLSLVGDKDCFGTGWTCTEGASLSSVWADVGPDAGDPAFTDARLRNIHPTWSHTFTPPVSGGYLTIRTAGIAEVYGPYGVFVDGLSVGEFPLDPDMDYEVETFTFGLTSGMLADGEIEVRFESGMYDWWAVDYAEVFASDVDDGDAVVTPEPSAVAIFAVGLLGLGFVARRREELGSA
jgi:hypothetical protein